MKLGIQYYRDPNPPEEFWAEDLSTIAASGFRMIGCWIPWRYVNPAEGCWELDRYVRLLDLAHQRNLSVRIQFVPESAPDWAAWKHPDARIVNENGQTIYLHPHPMLQRGGWPGLSLFHPAIQALTEDYFRQVIVRIKDHPAVAAWSIWNEIQAETTYDANAQAAYRSWLQSRYITMEAYNRARHAECRTFDDVQMPNPAIESSMVLSRASDLAEFRREWSIAEARRRARIVRACDTSRPVAAHSNNPSPYAYKKDDWGIAAEIDLYGDSHYNPHPFMDVMSFIKCRSVKGPGYWWMTEHCSGRMVYHYGHQTLSGETLANHALLALAHGADAASFWQYRSEWVEQEAPNFGLLHQDGSPSERLAALARIANPLQDFKAREMDFDAPSIAILIEPLDLVFRSAADAWRKQEWTEFNEVERWMWTLLNLGYTFDFLQAPCVAQRGIPKPIKIILTPSLNVLRPGISDTLAAWVKNGGHWVTGPFTGVFDPDGRVFRETPGDQLSSVFGLTVTDRISGESFPLEDSTGKTMVKGHHLFEHLTLQPGTETRLAYAGRPALVSRTFGNGQAYYAATFLGAGCETFLSEKDPKSEPLFQWMRGFLETMVSPPPCESNGVLWQTAAVRNRCRTLFLFNPRNHPVTLRVVLPTGYDAWRDVLSGESIPQKETNAEVAFSSQQVRILEGEPCKS